MFFFFTDERRESEIHGFLERDCCLHFIGIFCLYACVILVIKREYACDGFSFVVMSVQSVVSNVRFILLSVCELMRG